MANPIQHRMCIACRDRHPSNTLIRIQANQQMWPSEFLGHKLRFPEDVGGRSVWCCPKRSCLEKIKLHKKLHQKALRRTVNTEQLAQHLLSQLHYLATLQLRKAHQSGQLTIHRPRHSEGYKLDDAMLCKLLPQSLADRSQEHTKHPFEITLGPGKWAKHVHQTLSTMEWLMAQPSTPDKSSSIVILKRVPKPTVIG